MQVRVRSKGQSSAVEHRSCQLLPAPQSLHQPPSCLSSPPSRAYKIPCANVNSPHMVVVAAVDAAAPEVAVLRLKEGGGQPLHQAAPHTHLPMAAQVSFVSEAKSPVHGWLRRACGMGAQQQAVSDQHSNPRPLPQQQRNSRKRTHIGAAPAEGALLPQTLHLWVRIIQAWQVERQAASMLKHFEVCLPRLLPSPSPDQCPALPGPHFCLAASPMPPSPLPPDTLSPGCS